MQLVKKENGIYFVYREAKDFHSFGYTALVNVFPLKKAVSFTSLSFVLILLG